MGNDLQIIVTLISKKIEEICNSERNAENAIVKNMIVFSAVFVYNTHNKIGKREKWTRKGGGIWLERRWRSLFGQSLAVL